MALVGWTYLPFTSLTAPDINRFLADISTVLTSHPYTIYHFDDDCDFVGLWVLWVAPWPQAGHQPPNWPRHHFHLRRDGEWRVIHLSSDERWGACFCGRDDSYALTFTFTFTLSLFTWDGTESGELSTSHPMKGEARDEPSCFCGRDDSYTLTSTFTW